MNLHDKESYRRRTAALLKVDNQNMGGVQTQLFNSALALLTVNEASKVALSKFGRGFRLQTSYVVLYKLAGLAVRTRFSWLFMEVFPGFAPAERSPQSHEYDEGALPFAEKKCSLSLAYIRLAGPYRANEKQDLKKVKLVPRSIDRLMLT